MNREQRYCAHDDCREINRLHMELMQALLGKSFEQQITAMLCSEARCQRMGPRYGHHGTGSLAPFA